MKIWDSVWVNANLARFNIPDDYGVFIDSAIAVKENKIAWIGHMSELNSKPHALAKQVYDVGNRWLTPGLIDCHTHLIYQGNRMDEFEELLQGKNYEEILADGGGIYKTVALTRKSSEKELLNCSAERLKIWIKQGVTTIEIKSGYGLTLESEKKILRVAKKLEARYPITIKKTFLGAHAIPCEFKNYPTEYINNICEIMLPELIKERLVDAIDVFCEKGAFTPDHVIQLFESAKKHSIPVKIHAEQFSNLGGSMISAKYHALSADHLECINETQVEAMAAAKVIAVLLPSAYYFLRCNKKPPIHLFRKHKVPMAISTDHNPGSSPNTSLLLSMNMACVIFQLTPFEALLGTTILAAKALGINDTHGSLEIGKVADFAIWDIEHPSELSYYFGKNPCISVIKNGIEVDFNKLDLCTH
jgi:imidazolonepropionase